MWNSIKRMLGLGKSEQPQAESAPAAPYKVEKPDTIGNTIVTPLVVETQPVAAVVTFEATSTQEQAPVVQQKNRQPRKGNSMGKSKKAEFAFPTSSAPQEGGPQKADKPRRPRNKQPKKPQQ